LLSLKLLSRENVAVVCKFELVSDPSIRFVVATTHLLYNPKRQDVRLAQVQVLLAELDRIALVTKEGGEQHYLPVILSGDFNLQPYSAPYNLIVNGELKYENLAQRTLSTEGRSTNGQMNGRKLLPIKLGITDECQHVNQEIKVNTLVASRSRVDLTFFSSFSIFQLYHSENNKRQTDDDIELTKETVNRFQTGVLKHNFNFMSAYQKPENFVSTYQNQWILVDYMFYSSGSGDKTSNNPDLKLLAFLALPSSETCEQMGLRIPNDRLGSDHLMLASRFFLSSTSSSSSTKL
jgi:protein angel